MSLRRNCIIHEGYTQGIEFLSPWERRERLHSTKT